MDKGVVGRLHSSFEEMVRKYPDTGTEYWCARDLQMLLGYAQWRSFAAVIDKAITSCGNAGLDPKDHFAHISKMVDLGSGIGDFSNRAHADGQATAFPMRC
jgi:DNA-damage-inducible protein D